MEIKPTTKIDFGELLLETAKNAAHLTPAMQNVIARYMDVQSQPVRMIKPAAEAPGNEA